MPDSKAVFISYSSQDAPAAAILGLAFLPRWGLRVATVIALVVMSHWVGRYQPKTCFRRGYCTSRNSRSLPSSAAERAAFIAYFVTGIRYCKRTAPSSFARFRSNVPSGRCPALRAVSRTRQSEKPNAGRFLNCSSAEVTTSAS